MAQQFECVVVGAGPAGLTAALVLAKAGIEVLVLERGEYPGAKNMFGGVLYCKGLHKILPDFWKDAPVERPVSRWVTSFLNATSSFALDFKSARFCEAPYNAFTVLRSRFDRWYAQQVEQAGATILTGVTVEDFLLDHDRIIGVRTSRPDGDILASVVIAADSVNSLVARKGILRRDYSPGDVSLGVKEILAFPEESINRAFGLTGDEGAAYTFVGEATLGIPGGGFIYTNRDSVSVGIVTKLSSLSKQEKRPEVLLDAFKHHPLIWPLIKDGELREYLAHLIPEGKQDGKHPLYKAGLLAAGDAAGFALSTGFRVEGANYAIMSGLAAAEAVKSAGQRKDFSAAGLSVYLEHLREHGVLADLEKFRRAPQFFGNSRLYNVYPDVACKMGESIFSVEADHKQGLMALWKEALEGKVSWSELAQDVFAGWRALS